MLSYAPGKSLSHNQVAQHDVYGKQLRMLKDLALKYVAKQDANGNVDEDGFKDYVRFFGGPKREDGYRYDKVQVKKQDSPKNNMGYTAYNLNVLGYEEFAKADVLLRFYTAPGERAVLLYRDTIAFVSETMPETGDTVTVKSSRELSKDVMLNHRFQIG